MDEDEEGEDMSKFLSKLFDFLLKVSRWCIEKIINAVTKISNISTQNDFRAIQLNFSFRITTPVIRRFATGVVNW